MSQYISFYLKSKSNEYLPIGTFCRSDDRYEAISNYIEYGKTIPVSVDRIKNVIDYIQDDINDLQKNIDGHKKMIESISGFNNTVEEKTDMIANYVSSIKEIEDAIEWKTSAKSWYETLLTILEEAQSTQYYSNDKHTYNPDDYLYVGFEAPYPGDEDFEF